MNVQKFLKRLTSAHHEWFAMETGVDSDGLATELDRT